MTAMRSAGEPSDAGENARSPTVMTPRSLARLRAQTQKLWRPRGHLAGSHPANRAERSCMLSQENGSEPKKAQPTRPAPALCSAVQHTRTHAQSHKHTAASLSRLVWSIHSAPTNHGPAACQSPLYYRLCTRAMNAALPSVGCHIAPPVPPTQRILRRRHAASSKHAFMTRRA
jgi:hypothetical protein